MNIILMISISGAIGICLGSNAGMVVAGYLLHDIDDIANNHTDTDIAKALNIELTKIIKIVSVFSMIALIFNIALTKIFWEVSVICWILILPWVLTSMVWIYFFMKKIPKLEKMTKVIFKVFLFLGSILIGLMISTHYELLTVSVSDVHDIHAVTPGASSRARQEERRHERAIRRRYQTLYNQIKRYFFP